jgi:hypothetical protein
VYFRQNGAVHGIRALHVQRRFEFFMTGTKRRKRFWA